MSDCALFFFDSEFNGSIQNGELIDGHIYFEMDNFKYEWIPKEIKPINFYRKGLISRYVPMFFVKWDEILPINFDVEEVKEDVDKKEYMEMLQRQVVSETGKKLDTIKKKLKREPDRILKKTLITRPYLATDMDLNFQGRTKIKSKDGKIKTILPEMLRSTADMRFLKSMKEASMMTGKKGFRFRNLAIAAIFIASVGFFTLYSMMYLNVI